MRLFISRFELWSKIRLYQLDRHCVDDVDLAHVDHGGFTPDKPIKATVNSVIGVEIAA